MKYPLHHHAIGRENAMLRAILKAGQVRIQQRYGGVESVDAILEGFHVFFDWIILWGIMDINNHPGVNQQGCGKPIGFLRKIIYKWLVFPS